MALSPKVKNALVVSVNTALPSVALLNTPTAAESLALIVASATVVLSQKSMEAWKIPSLVTSKVADPASDESLKKKTRRYKMSSLLRWRC